jgi:polysaccharide biosynthesis protein PslG
MMSTDTKGQTHIHPLVSIVSLLLALPLVSGCVSAFVVEAPPPKTATLTPAPTFTPTLTPTHTPTASPTPTPTSTPTPIPTISIPMLTTTPTVTHRIEDSLGYLPDRTVPDAFGVEIHFRRTTQQELDYLAAGGFKWVRMDLFWHLVETEPGRYDFSDYDVLVKSMRDRDINMILILDYGNSLYDNGFPPTSPGAKAAFARFAATAAYRYRDEPITIIWDLWNEPNLDHFWTPEANAADYGRLAMQTAAAIRRADPDAVIAAPALAGFEWNYWRTLGSMGLFQQLDAITLHSYGVVSPEELTQPFLILRALIDSYSPRWRIPILSGEWGFASTEQGYSEGQQAQYLVRQWLVNLYHDLNVNIWYDWHDDGPDPHNPEHNFGTVRHDFTAKPTYRAAQTLNRTLYGYRFMRRIPLASPHDYLMLFQKEQDVALVAWTTSYAHTLVLPIPTSGVDVVEMTGAEGFIESEGEGLAVPISQSPRYLLFTPDQAVAELGGWRPAETLNRMVAGESETLHIILENHFIGPRYGEFQLWTGDTLRGQQSIVVPPKARQQIRLPVDTQGLEGSVSAELRFVPERDLMTDLQSAHIWLQVARPSD